jgi:hypothetical protein
MKTVGTVFTNRKRRHPAIQRRSFEQSRTQLQQRLNGGPSRRPDFDAADQRISAILSENGRTLDHRSDGIPPAPDHLVEDGASELTKLRR